jgi:putative transposase
MPRQSRLDTPGALHHIVIRGIERRKIFWDDADRDDFLERLDDLLKQTRTPCYAWALPPLLYTLFALRLSKGKRLVWAIAR